MSRTSISLLFLPALVLASAACRTAPVADVVDEPLATHSLSPDELAKAIQRAGAGLGWTIQERAPGEMTGTLRLRKHVAVVEIDYDTRSFSIRYRDSTNLLYDGSKIHRNYNRWIRNLAAAIREEVASHASS